MISRLFFASGAATVLSPLIQEARDRQRRRRAALLQMAALAAVFAFAAAANHGGGAGASLLQVSDSSAATQADVRSVVAEFDGALSTGDYARACGLLDPWMGMASVRAATDEVGGRGSCEQRLAVVSRILGPRLVDALERASMPSVEIARSDGGFIAAGVMQVPSEVVRGNNYDPLVSVAMPSPGAKVLITCPPLLCNSGFLRYVRARAA
jgi:hypothetical protein